MNSYPDFAMTYFNGFWFSVLFIFTNILLIRMYPAHFKKRLLKMPGFNTKVEKYFGILNLFIFQGLILIVCFIPIQFSTPWWIPGAAVFLTCYILYVKSLLDYARTQPGKPVTSGVYRYSRNPQQIFTIGMWIGIGLMLNSILIITLALIQLLTVYPTFVAQEKYCSEKYGSDFRAYMDQAPRYLTLFPGRGGTKTL